MTMKMVHNRVPVRLGELAAILMVLLTVAVGMVCIVFDEWFFKVAGVGAFVLLLAFALKLSKSDFRCRSLSVEDRQLSVEYKSGSVKRFKLPDEIKSICVVNDASSNSTRVELDGEAGKFFFNTIHFEKAPELDAFFQKVNNEPHEPTKARDVPRK